MWLAKTPFLATFVVGPAGRGRAESFCVLGAATGCAVTSVTEVQHGLA